MTLTSMARYELSRIPVARPCCRKAETAALLRFAGGLHRDGGRIVVEAELDTRTLARRLQVSVTEMFGYPAEVGALAPPGARDGSRYLVRVTAGHAGQGLARQAGLVDACGELVLGLPRQVVCGAACECVAAWRGAFLARGALTESARSMLLEVTCPAPEAALALVGAARRLGVPAKARDVRGADQVTIRNAGAITAMLTRLGAHETVLAWEERRSRREALATRRLSVTGNPASDATFRAANLCRSTRAAAVAAARADRALQILGSDTPGHLSAAGKLRIAHRQATLEALGQMADPPLTKDAIAGRVRRLLALADRRAAELGIPGTEACPDPDVA